MPWSTNPAILPYINTLQNTPSADSPATSAAKEYKAFALKGKDVSNYNFAQPILQQAASQARMQTERAGYGDAALTGASTPGAASVNARIAKIGGEETQEQAGEALEGQVAGATPGALNYLQTRGNLMDRYGLNSGEAEGEALDANSQWYQDPWLGLAQGLVGGAAKGAAAAFL